MVEEDPWKKGISLEGKRKRIWCVDQSFYNNLGHVWCMNWWTGTSRAEALWAMEEWNSWNFLRYWKVFFPRKILHKMICLEPLWLSPGNLASLKALFLIHCSEATWQTGTELISLRSNFSEEMVQFSSVAQSCLTLCDPMNHSMPGHPVHHKPQSLLKLMPIESVMPSSHLILCRPLLLLPPIPPSIRVFSNESALCMRWPKYWSFSFSIIWWWRDGITP